jgi:hypothetical protein
MHLESSLPQLHVVVRSCAYTDRSSESQTLNRARISADPLHMQLQNAVQRSPEMLHCQFWIRILNIPSKGTLLNATQGMIDKLAIICAQRPRLLPGRSSKNQTIAHIRWYGLEPTISVAELTPHWDGDRPADERPTGLLVEAREWDGVNLFTLANQSSYILPLKET